MLRVVAFVLAVVCKWMQQLPTLLAPTMLRVVAFVLAVGCKQMQQLPTLLCQQCWELLRSCWQWCANGCNNSQQCRDLHCIVGRIQPIRLWRPCVMSVRGPSNVGRAVQMDPTLFFGPTLRRSRKKRSVGSCWPKSLTAFNLCATTPNNTQKHITTCNREWNGRNM